MRRATLLLASLLLAAPATGDPVADPVPIERLAWLAGCWQAVGGEPGSGEQWTRPAGDTLLGTSRTVRGGRTVAWEFVRVERLADGRLAYVALPSGQRETVFPLLAATASSVTFENLEHDFPQRVIYSLGEDGLLRARIEGLRGGELRGIDFPLRRIACAPAPAAG
jgi:hypothetical protein